MDQNHSTGHTTPTAPNRARPRQSLKKDLMHTAVLALVAFGVLSASSVVVFPSISFPWSRSSSSTDDPIMKRQVLEYDIQGAQVKYTYVGAVLPETLAPQEVVPMRTESSYTIDLGALATADKKTGRNLKTIIYQGTPFVKVGKEWHYRETATASKDAFEAARKVNPLTFLFAVQTAYAVNVFSTPDDGMIEGSGADWPTAHAATSGTVSTTTAGGVEIFVNEVTIKSTSDIIRRAFLPFDTSSIPASANIASVSLTLQATTTIPSRDDKNDGLDYLTIVQTTNSNTGLAATDFPNCGAVTNPTEGIDTGERKDLTTMATTTPVTFNLNTTGIGWIKKSGQTSSCGSGNGHGTGYTCLGVREGHDTTNTAITATTLGNGAVFCSSEDPGTTCDPYLTVNYTSFAPWQFWDY